MVSILDEHTLLSEKAEAAIIGAAEAALTSEEAQGDACVAVMGDEEIQELNHRFRGMDKPTDVLSFAGSEGGELVLGEPDEFLGDIAISLPAAARQAEEIGHSVERELAFLTVHGILHLLGYDHIEQSDEIVMRERQRRIMEIVGDQNRW